LHPQIRELLELGVEYGIASLPSNNSIAPERWMPRQRRDRLHLKAGLHPEGEQDLEGFLRRLLEVRRAGAWVEVVYVLHPTRVARAQYYIDYFAAHRLRVRVLPFVGYYGGKAYPRSHSEEERKLMTLFPRLLRSLEDLDFHGIPCLAGQRSLYVNHQGGLQRCQSDPGVLQAPLAGPTACRVHKCDCSQLMLEELNSLDMIEEFGAWTQMLNSRAASRNFHDDEEAFRHHYARYRALMSKYEKTGADDPEETHWTTLRTLALSDENSIKTLEKNYYGPRTDRQLVADAQGLRFSPGHPADHLATPYWDVCDEPESRGRRIRVVLAFSGPNESSEGFEILVQDESCSNLLATVVSGAGDGHEAGECSHSVRVPPDVKRVRLVMRSHDGKPIRLPSLIRVERSERRGRKN
jgi:hypothetical protein